MPNNKAIIGEEYVYKRGNLFRSINFPPVKVLDVKDGWVNYAMPETFIDGRMEEKSFLSMYKKVGEDLTRPSPIEPTFPRKVFRAIKNYFDLNYRG